MIDYVPASVSACEAVRIINAITNSIRDISMATCVTERHTALAVALTSYAPEAVNAAACCQLVAKKTATSAMPRRRLMPRSRIGNDVAVLLKSGSSQRRRATPARLRRRSAKYPSSVERTSAITLRSDSRFERRLQPRVQRIENRMTGSLSFEATRIGRFTAQTLLDRVEHSDPADNFCGKRRLVHLVKIDELEPYVRPTRRLEDLAAIEEFAEPGISVGLQHSRKAREMALRMLAFAIGAVAEPDGRSHLPAAGRSSRT